MSNNERIVRYIVELNSTPRSKVRNNHFVNARATIESPVPNTRHTVGNGDGGQARATIESALTNTLHTVGNNQILNLCIFITI